MRGVALAVQRLAGLLGASKRSACIRVGLFGVIAFALQAIQLAALAFPLAAGGVVVALRLVDPRLNQGGFFTFLRRGAAVAKRSFQRRQPFNPLVEAFLKIGFRLFTLGLVAGVQGAS